jgi:hypothetical protein
VPSVDDAVAVAESVRMTSAHVTERLIVRAYSARSAGSARVR